MNVKAAVGDQLGRARSFAERVRAVYQRASQAALAAGKERLSELAKAGENLQPRIRTTFDESLIAAQALLDEFNQVLADRAIPPYRKAGVTQKRLEEKAVSVQKAKAGSAKTLESASIVGDASIAGEEKRTSTKRRLSHSGKTPMARKGVGGAPKSETVKSGKVAAPRKNAGTNRKKKTV